MNFDASCAECDVGIHFFNRLREVSPQKRREKAISRRKKHVARQSNYPRATEEIACPMLFQIKAAEQQRKNKRKGCRNPKDDASKKKPPSIFQIYFYRDINFILAL